MAIEKSIKKINSSAQKGFGVIEIILVIAVGIAVFLSIEQYLSLSLKSIDRDTGQTEAIYWIKALMEEARAARDENWTNISNLTVGSNYYFIPSGATPQKWTAQAGSGIQGKYTMRIKTAQVQRDVSDNIIASGGTVDANTLKIIASVSWLANGVVKQIDISEYLTNYK